MQNRILSLLLSLLILLSLSSCASPKSAFTDDGRVKITATLFPQYDFARVVGGDRVQIIKLLPPGTETHTFEPTATDIITVSDADLFLYTGADMEPWAQTMLKGIDNAPTAIDLSAYSLTSPAQEHDHGEEEHGHTVDPHLWLNPKNAIRMVQVILDALISIDPDGKGVYRKNADDYVAKLEELDKNLTAIAQAAKNKTLVFGGRFAFAHLCEQYGFDHISAYHGCDVQAEPSAAQITQVIDFVKDNGITHIFKEEMVSPQSVTTIEKETGASVLLLHSCHNVTKEELEAGVSYLSLMQSNVTNIRTALNV